MCRPPRDQAVQSAAVRLATRLAIATCLLAGMAAPAAMPASANAAPCLLIFTCPDPAPAPAPPPPPAPLPLPPPPLPGPVTGPPVLPPPGNPECKPKARSGGFPASGAFIGVGDAPVAANPRYRRCTLATMVASGVRMVRVVFAWFSTETARGRVDLRFYDGYVEQLARYRIRVLPVLYTSPRFYSAAPRASYPERVQPRGNREFARFSRLMAQRYGPRGSFWRSHPTVPRLPLRSWQVWNEPNVRFFWAPRPSAAQYVRMLAAVSRAIRAVDRRAEIVTGGLPESRYGTPVTRYVNAIYRAGGARWFDTLAIHPYSRTAAQAVRAVERARRLMNRRGDRRGRIWVTEFGWASGGPRHPFRAGERGQARKIEWTMRTLWRRRTRLRLRGVIQVMWGDLPRYRSDYWGLHVGLYSRDGRAKRAAGAFARTARRLR